MVNNTQEDICAVKKYLEGYGASKSILKMMEYEKEYFADESKAHDDDALIVPGGDEVLLKSKMYDVRRFILGMEDGKEKALLFYHYIRGFSVEKCSEMMGIGRTSAFRLKKKALASAAARFAERAKKNAVA
jgi:DNA-directed RNA polymerase specialized sigma24 family protein